MLADLQLGHNLITNLNGSILPLRNLTGLNLNHNRIRVFDLKEIQGLKELQTLDLSYNGIHTIIGRMEVIFILIILNTNFKGNTPNSEILFLKRG